MQELRKLSQANFSSVSKSSPPYFDLSDSLPVRSPRFSALDGVGRVGLLQILLLIVRDTRPGRHDRLGDRAVDPGDPRLGLVRRRCHLVAIRDGPPGPLEALAHVRRHVHEAELDVLAAVPVNLSGEGLEVRDGGGVDVVHAAEVQHDQADGRQAVGVGVGARRLAEAPQPLLRGHGPVALLLRAVGAVVHGRVVRLDRVQDALGQAVRVGEEDRLVEAEHVHVLEHGVRHVAGRQAAVGVERRGELGARGRCGGGDADEGLAEDEVDDVEADGDEDAELGRVEEREPESQHGRDEVDEGGLPEAVECRRWVDERPDGADDDAGERRLGDPVERAHELVDAHEDDGRRDEPGERRLHLARGVDGRPAHGAADAHGVEKAVEEVAHAEVAELLTLVGGIIVLDTEGSCDGCVLDGGTDKYCDRRDGHAADEVRGRDRRCLQAFGFDLDHGEQIVIRVRKFVVDGVADASVKHQGQEGSRDGQHPDDLVLVSPSLPGLVEDGQEQDAGKPNSAGDPTCLRE